MSTLQARMRQLIGTTAEWAADDIVIGDGEIAAERLIDGSVRIKIGNGVDPFSALIYAGGGGSGFGAGYEWGVPTPRSYGVEYTSPDHPIMVSHISHCIANNGESSITVNGVTVAAGTNGGNGSMVYTICAIVPPDTTYEINQSNLDDGDWLELRADY